MDRVEADLTALEAKYSQLTLKVKQILEAKASGATPRPETSQGGDNSSPSEVSPDRKFWIVLRHNQYFDIFILFCS